MCLNELGYSQWVNIYSFKLTQYFFDGYPNNQRNKKARFELKYIFLPSAMFQPNNYKKISFCGSKIEKMNKG